MAFISSSNDQLSIRSEGGSKCCLFESGKVLVNLMCDWIVDLDFGGTGNSEKVRLNWHHIDIIDGSKLFDGYWKLKS